MSRLTCGMVAQFKDCSVPRVTLGLVRLVETNTLFHKQHSNSHDDHYARKNKRECPVLKMLQRTRADPRDD